MPHIGTTPRLVSATFSNCAPDLRVLEKHFVEIAEPEQQQRVLGQFAFDAAILRHHRSELRFGGHSGGNVSGYCVKVERKFCRNDPFWGAFIHMAPSNGERMNANELPMKARIASPCAARWEDMGGDQRVRFCDHCHKNVYNLSAMTAAEGTALLAAKGGQVCARIYQRADGTVLTEDCPVGVARQWRRVKTLVAGGVATILLTLANVSAIGREPNNAPGGRSSSRLMTSAEAAVWKLKEKLGLNPPAYTMGEMRVVSPPKPKAPPGSRSAPVKN